MSEKNSFRVRLMRWGDSSSSGRTVTLKLPDDTEDHPFKGLDVGSRNGQLMEMEITLLEGDAELKTLGPKSTEPSSTPLPLPVKDIAGSTSPDLIPSEEPSNPGVATHELKATEASNAMPVGHDTMTEASQLPNIEPADFDSYANQMGNAAETLAAVAEELSKAAEDGEDQDHEDDGQPPLTRGQQAAVRAVDLCKSIDQQRAGFFYFMMSRYPTVPNLDAEPGNWSRDAKVTRDRVCHHCEMEGITHLEEDTTAQEKFEALENEYERHERLR